MRGIACGICGEVYDGDARVQSEPLSICPLGVTVNGIKGEGVRVTEGAGRAGEGPKGTIPCGEGVAL